ncbi:MAG TPA: hypothetical protein VE890_03105 [Thermoguttaceae bacterium]|nr:hypothetical protein [Thermoguttaceae bacterium]
MTLVGKIFTVLIFVMSLVFMSFTVAVYATHKNWRDIVINGTKTELPLVEQLEQKENRNQELRDQKASLEAELAAQKKASDQVHSKLESEYDLLKANHEGLVGRHADLLTDQRDKVAALTAAHNTLKSLRDRSALIEDARKSAEQDKDAAMKELIRQTEVSHAAVAELERVKKRQVEILQDLAKAKEVLAKFGLNGDPAGHQDVAPIIDAIVLAAPQQDLIEISVGEDDGLRQGHQLEVFRVQGGRRVYVGRIVVIRTDYDKSVCKIDPNYRQSPVQVNDRVFSKQQLQRQ